MDTATAYCTVVAIMLVLAAILRWTWITPERFPTAGRRGWPRELLTSGAACLLVSAILFAMALFGDDTTTRFIPALVFGEMGGFALYFAYLTASIPQKGDGRTAAIKYVWLVMLQSILAGYVLILVPRVFSLVVPDLLGRGVVLFVVVVSIALCAYCFRHRDALTRKALVIGCLPVWIPFVLIAWVRKGS